MTLQLTSKGSQQYKFTREKILQEQGGKCAVCKQVPKVPQLEHDHKTWLIRGVTCASCNILLGRIENDWRSGAKKMEPPELATRLRQLANYLTQEQHDILYPPKPKKRPKRKTK